MLYLSQTPLPIEGRIGRSLREADGWLFFGLFDEASRVLRNIPTGEQDSSPVLGTRIRLMLHKKKWKAAEKLSLEAMSRYPEEWEFIVQRAFALRQLKRNEKVIAVIMNAPKWIRKTGILHYNLACYEARLGDPKIARRCLTAAVEINANIKKTAELDPDLQSLWEK